MAAGTTDQAGTGPLVTYAVEVERGLFPGTPPRPQAVDDVLVDLKGCAATETATW